MNTNTVIFALLAVFAAFIGFGFHDQLAAPFVQVAFFVLVIAALASLVFERRRPV